jgi:hypothetical protein
MTAPLLLVLVLACGGKDSKPAPAPPAGSGRKGAASCEGLPGDLAAAAAGDTGRVTLDADGRVTVTVEVGADATLPRSFHEDKRAMGHVQGRVAPSDLCALAATPGVLRVRTPRMASPK